MLRGKTLPSLVNCSSCGSAMNWRPSPVAKSFSVSARLSVHAPENGDGPHGEDQKAETCTGRRTSYC